MPTPARPDLPAQTAMRGLAAMAVFFAHARFYSYFPQYPGLARVSHIFSWSGNAVDIFFELSGFILCYVYLLQDVNWKQYALARFARIYPLYLATLLFFVLLNVLAWSRTGVFASGTTFPVLVSNFLLIQRWPLVPQFDSLIAPSWSISVEVFLYIYLFPGLCFFEKFFHPVVKVIMAIFPVGLLTLLYVSGHGWQDVLMDPIPPLRGILCFTSGFFVCALCLRQGFVSLPRYLEAFFLIVVVGSLLFEFPLNRYYITLAWPFLVYVAACSTSLTVRLLNFPILCWLGEISYSIYLWHWPLFKALSIVTGVRKMGPDAVQPTTFHSILYCAVTLVTVLVVAHFSHYRFERPVAKWLRRKRG